MTTLTQQSEFRQAQRSNTLITARAVVGDNAWTLRIRNLSACGALVESEVHVDVGCSILLMRGGLRVAGEVAWRREGLFGVRFFEPLAVEDWLGVPVKAAIPPNGFHKEAQACREHPEAVLTQRISEEISLVARMIGIVAKVLSEDPILRVRHATRVQELCIGEQMLAEISAIMTEHDKQTAIEAKATGPMRNRLLR